MNFREKDYTSNMEDIFENLKRANKNLFSNESADAKRTKYYLSRLNNNHRLNLAILFVTLAMVSVLGYSLFKEPEEKEQVLGVATEVVPTEIQAPVLPTVIVPTDIKVVVPSKVPTTVPRDERYVYYLTLNNKSDEVDPVDDTLANYLINALDMNRLDLVNIYYDTRQGSPYEDDKKYDFSYYVMTNRPLRLVEIEDYASIIGVEAVDDGLMSFLENSQYCGFSDDCVIRDNLCSYGAYNHFQQYLDGYMCRGRVDSEGNSLVVFDEEKQCKAEKVYSDPACVNNLCVPFLVGSKCI